MFFYNFQECFRKTATSIKALMKPDCKIIVCTGQVQLGIVRESLPGMELTSFEPKHAVKIFLLIRDLEWVKQ